MFWVLGLGFKVCGFVLVTLPPIQERNHGLPLETAVVSLGPVSVFHICFNIGLGLSVSVTAIEEWWHALRVSRSMLSTDS